MGPSSSLVSFADAVGSLELGELGVERQIGRVRYAVADEHTARHFARRPGLDADDERYPRGVVGFADVDVHRCLRVAALGVEGFRAGAHLRKRDRRHLRSDRDARLPEKRVFVEVAPLDAHAGDEPARESKEPQDDLVTRGLRGHRYPGEAPSLDELAGALHEPLQDLLDIDGRWLQGQFFYQPEVLFTHSQHAREHLTVEMALYLAHLLAEYPDTRIRNLLSQFLTENRFRITVAGNADEARRQLAGLDFDLLILDVMMPGESGVELTKSLREQKNVPILMPTALSETDSRIAGLEAGADDYLPKPFERRELVARVRAILRRGGPARQAKYTVGGLTVDRDRREVLDRGGTALPLTAGEFDLLGCFVERAGRTLSRDQLLDITQGRTAGAFERSVDILVSRLRRKLEPDPGHPAFIKTVRSGGYLFTPVVEVL